jgi:hypothetical protein
MNRTTVIKRSAAVVAAIVSFNIHFALLASRSLAAEQAASLPRPLIILRSEHDSRDFAVEDVVGIQLVVHRATMGCDGTDTRYEADATKIREINQQHAFRIRWGAYHFGRMVEDPVTQARYFVKRLVDAADSVPERRLLMMLNIDSYGQSKSKYMGLYEAIAFIGEVERITGKKPLLYTSIDFLGARFSDASVARGLHDSLGGVLLWLSDTRKGDEPTNLPPDSPWQRWTFWRYAEGFRAKSQQGAAEDNANLGEPSTFDGTDTALAEIIDLLSWDLELREPIGDISCTQLPAATETPPLP